MPKTTPGGKAILQKDKEYRKAQNAKARANRARRDARVNSEWREQLAQIPGHPESDVRVGTS